MQGEDALYEIRFEPFPVVGLVIAVNAEDNPLIPGMNGSSAPVSSFRILSHEGVIHRLVTLNYLAVCLALVVVPSSACRSRTLLECVGCCFINRTTAAATRAGVDLSHGREAP